MMFPQLDRISLGRRRNAHVDLPQGAGCSWAVDPNQVALLRFAYSLKQEESKADAMFKSSGLSDELLALKGEISRLLHAPADDVFNAAKDKSEAFVEQIKATLSDLGTTLSEEEEHVERLVAERPLVAIASAFALGIAVGFMLRRH
jgi:ElaB/YqjD/DUF883 family membrane-anchored ribosome-binding protein